jgi:hypothetical protein
VQHDGSDLVIKNKVRLLVSLTPAQVKALKRLARHDKQPVAHHVRVAVQRYLDSFTVTPAQEQQ